jgi:flagellar motor switch protein FliN/FliY
MTMHVTPDAVTRAFAREMVATWSARSGSPASLTVGEPATTIGWSVSVPLTGVATGQATIWFDAIAATAAARRLRALDQDPADNIVADVLGELVSTALRAVVASPDGTGLVPGAAAASKASASPAARPFVVSGDDGFGCPFAVSIEFAPAVAMAGLGSIELGDSRLEAVLEVDLPLVVRFGRAVMPLRAVAELSPGAVVDMGRSPDEPVELLVGDRLIARGEVVIVGGNYGVRITELTSGRRSTDLEARA